jgi:hypothetical protein
MIMLRARLIDSRQSLSVIAYQIKRRTILGRNMTLQKLARREKITLHAIPAMRQIILREKFIQGDS